MSVINSVTQCGFCAHVNSAMLPNCTLCGDILTPNTLSLSVLASFQQTLNPLYCTCGRQLLPNARSCTFCNAHWALTPIGISRTNQPRVTQRFMRYNEYVDLINLLEMLQMPGDSQLDDQLHVQTPLSAEARDKYLQPVSQLNPGVCAICLDELGEVTNTNSHVVQLPCCNKHYHASCVNMWFRNKCTCPMCRHDLNQRAREEAEVRLC